MWKLLSRLQNRGKLTRFLFFAFAERLRKQSGNYLMSLQDHGAHLAPIAILPNGTTPSVRAALEAFFRHRRLFLWLVLAIELAGLAAAIFTHRQYKSETKFLVQNARGNVVITPERTSQGSAVSDVTEEQLNSELEVLHSQDVIEGIADPGWASLDASSRTAPRVRQHEKLLGDFQKNYSAELVRKSNIIDVNLLASTPDEAQKQLTALSAAYLTEHRQLQRPNGSATFFASQASHFQQAWDDANRQLVEFQQKNRLVSLPDQEASLDRQIESLQTRSSTLESSLQDLNGRISSGLGQLATMPMRQATQQRTIPNQASVQELNTLLVQLQNRRTELLSKFLPTDRMVQETERQISDTRNALHEAKTLQGNEVTTDVSPAWQQVSSNLSQYKINRAAAMSEKQNLDEQRSGLTKQLAALQALTVQYNTLQSQAAEFKDNYQLYSQKRDQAKMEDAMDEQKLLNVAIAQHPTFSLTPVKPRRMMTIALSTVTAIFIGLCAIYLAEMARNTLATPQEVELASSLPVLATIPLSRLRSSSETSPGGSADPRIWEYLPQGQRNRPPRLSTAFRNAVSNFWRQREV